MRQVRPALWRKELNRVVVKLIFIEMRVNTKESEAHTAGASDDISLDTVRWTLNNR